MATREDSVIVGRFTLWDFDQDVSHIVYCRIMALDTPEFTQEEVLEIIQQIGLWEDHIHINKIESLEISDKNSSPIIPEHRENKYRIAHFNDRAEKITLSYSKEEITYRTRFGKDRNLSIDEIRTQLQNVNKWMTLQKIKKILLQS